MEEGTGSTTLDEVAAKTGMLTNMDDNNAWVLSTSPISCSPEDNKLTQTITFDPPPAKQFGDTPL